METNDTFKEDLLAVLFHLRISQLMLTVLRDNTHYKDNIEYYKIRKKASEPLHKLDWYIETSLRILNDPELKAELDSRDDKLSNIANMAEYIARHDGDITNEINFMMSTHWRKDFMWRCWQEAQKQTADVIPSRMAFENWYHKVFPNNITSLSKPANEHIHGS